MLRMSNRLRQAALSPAPFRRGDRAIRSGPRVAMLVSLLSVGLASCTGAPESMAARPAFELMTPAGLASVSIRQPMRDMSDTQFESLVRAAMEQAAHTTAMAAPVAPPYPQTRIVWHVEQDPNLNGVSRLTANVFSGQTPYAYEEAPLPNGAPRVAAQAAIASVSRRVMDDVSRDAMRRSGGSGPGEAGG
jgi:hypothetical protein